jgi:repressor LexA
MESKTTPNLSPKQCQYLAFIYYYTKLNRQAPAEADFQKYFRVSPPSVHNMIVKLDESGFISREPGKSRSIRLLVDREHIPDLD